MARPQCVLPRRRAGVPHILHQRPRRRGDGDHVELPRYHAAWPSGDLGKLARGLPPDPAVQVVELARQLRRRGLARPQVGRGLGRQGSHLPKARRGDQRMTGAENLSLAAAPTFAAMALLTGIHGGSMPDMLCSAARDASPLTGMAPMYWLMSAFHSAPWLKLIFRQGSGARRSSSKVLRHLVTAAGS